MHALVILLYRRLVLVDRNTIQIYDAIQFRLITINMMKALYDLVYQITILLWTKHFTEYI
jgi:hypothetical protein